MFSPDQFTHILPPPIWCINTPRYYFWGTTFIIRNQKCYGKKSEQRSACPNELVLLLTMRCFYQGVWGWGYIWAKLSLTQRLTKCQADLKQYHPWLLDASTRGVHLTKGQPDPKADKMSSWPEAVPPLTARCLYQGGTSDQRSAWPKGWQNVKLTWSSTTLDC